MLIHGRNQGPADMLTVAERIDLDGMPYVAVEAAQASWYPNRFMAPLSENQPWLDHALERLEQLIRNLERRGIERANIALLGFSQGACLASEFIYRNPQRWGGLIAFTGGLIGPETTTWTTTGQLDDTPVLIGNGDQDEWVPKQRTEQSADVFARMGGDVQLRIYPDRPHEVSDDEIERARVLLARLLPH
ncbi:Phospholipase/Carboxylesterase [compost metagenome]